MTVEYDPHAKCPECRVNYTKAQYRPWCSVDCREDHFVSIGAGDARRLVVAKVSDYCGDSWWDRGQAHP